MQNFGPSVGRSEPKGGKGASSTDWIAQDRVALKILQNACRGYSDRIFLARRGVSLDEYGDPARAGYVCDLIG
jgi:hypothetical protein